MVGICAWQLKEADELKRSALLCDVVEVPSKLDFASNLIGSSDCSPQVFDEVSKAMGGGPISVNEALFDVARPYVRKFQELHFLHQAGLLRFRPHDWAGPPSPASGPQTTWTAPSELYVEAPRGTLRLSVEEIEQLPELTARIRAASLRSQPEEEFVLIGSRFPNLEAWVSELPPVQTDVVNITLEQLAEPDGQTPWQDLIEFRNDDNSRQQQLALRRWMRKMASGDFKQFEIAEELEYLYHEYERHMALHRMKINKGTLETIITVAGEVAEDLVKIKWGQLMKLCFVTKHRKIDLLEAEGSAPGREVAYIANTRSRFQ